MHVGPAEDHSRCLTVNREEAYISPVTPWLRKVHSHLGVAVQPTAGHRSNPGLGPAPRWRPRRPAPWLAPAAPAETVGRQGCRHLLQPLPSYPNVPRIILNMETVCGLESRPQDRPPMQMASTDTIAIWPKLSPPPQH